LSNCFERADLTTLLHETGCFFLSDLDSEERQTDGEDRFARVFEAHLLECKVPSAGP